jgi:hypothetical protein
LFFGSAAAPASATYLSTDTTTTGSWQGVYGKDGYNVFGDYAALPSYANVTPSGESPWTWTRITYDSRGLQRHDFPITSAYIASCWYSSTGEFSIDVSLTDGQAHKVSIYALDWDLNGRSEKVDVVDPSTGNVLDSRTISSFGTGTYLSWTLKGNVQLRFTRITGTNPVVSGLFFG